MPFGFSAGLDYPPVPDFLQYLMKNSQDDPQSVPDANGMSVADMFNQRPPEHRANDALMDMISQMPQRQEPSTYRNVLGALGGLREPDTAHALQAQDLIRYRPYYQQMGDWQAQLQPLQAAATQERYANANDTRFINYMLQRENAARRTDEQIKKDENQRNYWEGVLGNKKEELELRKTQLELQRYRNENPRAIVKALEDGTLIDASKHNAQPIMINGKPARVTSQAQLQKLIANRTIEAIEARGEQTRENIGVAGDVREWVGKSLIEARPTLTEAQIRVNINRAMLAHPEWAKYYDVNTKTFRPPADTDPVILQQMNDEIYGTPTVRPNVTGPKDIQLPSGDTNAPPAGTPSTTTAPAATPTKPRGKQATPPGQPYNAKEAPTINMKRVFPDGSTRIWVMTPSGTPGWVRMR